MKTKPIIIVAGEPFSVFSEILSKSITKKKINTPIILICSQKLIEKQIKKLKLKIEFCLIDRYKMNFNNLSNKKINIINVDFNFDKPFNKISIKSNHYISECFKIALQIINNNKCLGLINGPISKKDFLKEKYYGITEYLADKSNRKNKVAMLIYNKKLSVSPITTHIPLKNVYKSITKNKIIRHVKLIDNFYKRTLKIKPKIAITGLNPHCESNYKSSEETNIIIPAIKMLAKNKIDIKGPFSADTVFLKDNTKNFDVIVGMYHDQVLTPAKTLFGFSSINITLGLPFIRISPDHGPNSSMLGKNRSNPKSLTQALKFLDN